MAKKQVAKKKGIRMDRFSWTNPDDVIIIKKKKGKEEKADIDPADIAAFVTPVDTGKADLHPLDLAAFIQPSGLVEKKSQRSIQARDALNNAIKAGKIPPPTSQKCAYCDSKASQYHHYLGYEEKHWLHVKPVCRKCHEERG